MYTKKEVFDNTLKYYQGNDLATKVWMDKYCLKKGDSYMEDSPVMMHKRLAKEFARIESKYPNPIGYEQILDLLSNGSILPGGSLLYGIGNNYSISSLGNCFVVGNSADSYGGICLTDQEQAQLMKRRAGVGHDISHLRPANTDVTNAAGTSTGAVSFMHRFSNTTREVAQNGRRGALMLTMDITHPDADKFITSKDDTTKITGANISVKVSDEFMQRKLKMDARKERSLWNKLVHQAWKSAEPGVLFWDKITSESPADCYEGFESTSTNPCGEIPLCPYDSCRLLSVNLYNFVDNPFTDKASFNWNRFKQVVYIAQKLMDDVVDLEEEKINKILEKIENDPEDSYIKEIEKNLWIKIKQKLLSGRRTGLSGIGLADVLAALGHPYGSSSGITVADDIYPTLAITAYKSSVDMAKDRGAFPIWDLETEECNPFIKRIMNEVDMDLFEKWREYGRRNIALLTIPPSGTISLLAGISSGIEPVYQLSYKRRRKVEPNHPNISFTDKNGDCWEEYNVLHPKFSAWLHRIDGMEGFEKYSKYYDDDFIKGISSKSPYHNSTAYELNPLDRVKMQAKLQKWVDHSISSTVNLPNSATEEDVANIYTEAWKLGCKGITVYRDGCRDGVLLSNIINKNNDFVQNNAPKRPKYVPCDVFTPTIRNKQYIVAVGILDEQPYEIFAFSHTDKFKITNGFIKKVKRGRYDITTADRETYCENITSEMSSVEEDRTRLISWGLRHGGGIKHLVEQLGKAQGNGFQDFSKVIARTLKRYIPNEAKVTGATCDNCGSDSLIYRDGCTECEACGIQKCG